MDLFLPTRFRTFVQLAPYELHKDLEGKLVEKLRLLLEGTCSRYGYIRPGSLEIVRRSAGVCMKQHFNGHLRFEVVCKGYVCNPAQGAVYKAIVRQKNALGLQAESMLELEDGREVPILDIIVPRRAAGIQSDIDLDMVEIGAVIHVQVLGKRYQLRDSRISIVGRAVQPPMAQTGAEEDEETEEPLGDEEEDGEASQVDEEDGEEDPDGEQEEDDDAEDPGNPVRIADLGEDDEEGEGDDEELEGSDDEPGEDDDSSEDEPEEEEELPEDD